VTVFDSLVFIGRSYAGVEFGEDELLRAMDDLGIDKAAVCPARPADYHLPPVNDWVASVVARHADRLVFLCRVDPNREDAPGEVVRCFSELGARGLFLHPAEELFRINERRIAPVVSQVTGQTGTLFIATGYPWVSGPLQVGVLAERFPDLTIVMTNGGQFNISGLGMVNAWMALEQHPNLLVQTAGEYRQDFIEDVAARIGGDRILFASNGPYLDQRYELTRARQADLTEENRRLMLGATAENLFSRRRAS
jgi:uncharacterized protein